MYHYGGNNPIKYTDPTGEFVISFAGAFLITSVGFLVTYFTALSRIQSNDKAYHPADIRSGNVSLSSGKQENKSLQVDTSEDHFESDKSNILNIKAKERREQERQKAKVEKHLDPDWEEPASEDFAKWKAQEAEEAGGKEARRKLHDAKLAGEPDRSKNQLEIDNE